MITEAADPVSLSPMAICVVGGAIVVWIASLGVALKLAFKIVGASAPSYVACLGYSLMIPIVNLVIGSIAMATVGHGYGLVSILQLAIQIKILKAAGDCGGWRAFFAGIVQSFIMVFFTIAIVLGIAFSGVIDPETFKGPMQEFAEQAKQQQMEQQSGAAAGGGAETFWGSATKTDDGATLNPYFKD